MKELWPYILPLPRRPAEQYKILMSVFSSKIAMELLKNISLERKSYQKDLIRKLSKHSNKSVINYLRRLVKVGVLEEGEEFLKVDKRNVRVKWYTATSLGRWLMLLLTPSERLSREDVVNVVIDLLKVYASSVAELCVSYGLNPEFFRSLFNEAYTSSLK